MRARFNKTFATFARMWSANMIPIIEKSGGWPGFRYTDEEQAAMEKQLDRFPRAMQRYRIFAFANAIVTIALMLLFCLIMVWSLTALQRTHGQLPSTVFGAAMGAVVALSLGIGIPFSLYLSCALYRHFSWNSDLNAEDAEFGRRLFGKFCRQTTRIAILVSIGLFIFSLWPNEESNATSATGMTQRPLGFWERAAAPLAAFSINLLTFCYYFGRNRSNA